MLLPTCLPFCLFSLTHIHLPALPFPHCYGGEREERGFPHLLCLPFPFPCPYLLLILPALYQRRRKAPNPGGGRAEEGVGGGILLPSLPLLPFPIICVTLFLFQRRGECSQATYIYMPAQKIREALFPCITCGRKEEGERRRRGRGRRRQWNLIFVPPASYRRKVEEGEEGRKEEQGSGGPGGGNLIIPSIVCLSHLLFSSHHTETCNSFLIQIIPHHIPSPFPILFLLVSHQTYIPLLYTPSTPIHIQKYLFFHIPYKIIQ